MGMLLPSLALRAYPSSQVPSKSRGYEGRFLNGGMGSPTCLTQKVLWSRNLGLERAADGR